MLFNEPVWKNIKSKILVKVIMLEKVEDTEGKISLKVTDSNLFKMSGKEFKMNLSDDEAAGIKHTVIIVNEEPAQFQINAIYILANGKKAWIYIEKDNN